MSWKRIIGYGLLYWLVSAVLTFVQILFVTSSVVGYTIFYGFVVLAPLAFCWIFFHRMFGAVSWQSGLRLAGSWIVLFSILDGLIFSWWLGFPMSRYFSWQFGFAYGVLVVMAMVIAHLVGQRQQREGPEGLA